MAAVAVSVGWLRRTDLAVYTESRRLPHGCGAASELLGHGSSDGARGATQRKARSVCAIWSSLPRLPLLSGAVADPNRASPAASLIERLLEDELGTLRLQVGAGHRQQALKALDERGNAQELVREQYTGRYAFELLQNANDAAVDSDTRAAVRFQITDHSLLVANMGAAFGEEEVRAICSLGRSSKNPRKTVGYKGLGFKSVGEITTSPQVFSPPHCFGFDAATARHLVEADAGPLAAPQRLPVYAFPLPLTYADAGADAVLVQELLSDDFVTVLRLPYRSGVTRADVADAVSDMLRPELLLLLDATDRLELTGSAADFEAESLVEAGEPFNDVVLSVDGELQQWRVQHRKHDIPDRQLVAAIRGWDQVTTVTTTVAARHDGHGRVDHGPERPLHVYFPLDDSAGTSLLLHADFALDLDRRHVATTPQTKPYNDWLTGLLVAAAADAAAHLAREQPADGSILKALTPKAVSPGTGRSVRDHLDERLTEAKFVPCLDGVLRKPAAAAMLPVSVAALEDVDGMLDLLALPAVVSVDPDNHATAAWLKTLGMSTLNERQVLAVLRPPDEDADENDVERFYTALVRWWDRSSGRPAFEQALETVRCVRVEGGEWVASGDDVFFPRERGADLPDDLPVSITDVPEVPRLTMLLEQAGVRRFRWRELLLNIVLPRLTATEVPPPERTQSMRVLRAYYAADPRGDQEVLSRARDVLVPARSAHGGTASLRAAGRTYFSASWTGTTDLETLYGTFGAPEFLDTAPPDGPEEQAEEQAFLSWLGVAALPRLLTAHAERREQWRTSVLQNHPHLQAQRQAVQDWLQHPEVASASRCDQGHPETQQLKLSHAVDRLPELLAVQTVETATVLARVLATNWMHYRGGLRAEFTCVNTSHWGATPRPAPSVLAVLLRDTPWLPCQLDGQPTLRRPAEVWRPGGELPQAAGQHLPLLDPALTDRTLIAAWLELGVVEAGAPGGKELADLLRRLGEQHDDQVLPRRSPPVELANWAMHRLDDAMARAGADDGVTAGPVPLVARYRNGYVIGPAPYTCDDPLLTDTWVDEVPVLIDRDVATLRARLDLQPLERAVQIEPRVEGLLSDRAESLHHRLRLAGPYLAASALETGSPRAAERVLPRLRSLELLACRHLALEYLLGDRRKSRPEATSFLAERDASHGRPRKIGTVYLELQAEDAEPDWFTLGPQLAQFLGVPGQRDAFSLLLGADDATRRSFLTSRGITQEAIETWAIALATTMEPVEAQLDTAASAAPEAPPPAEPAPTDGKDEEPAGSSSGRGPVDQDPPPLQVRELSMEDGPTIPVAGPGARVARPSSGTGGRIDWDRTAATSRRTGSRGEQWAYEQERLRVQTELGLDPDAHVHWQSQAKEDSNYDIRSVDPDGHRIYIEVKASDSDNLSTPVEISSGELQLGLQYRERYYIYRVLNANTATPRLVRFGDPVGRILNGLAAIRTSGAKLYLAPNDESDA